VEVIPPQQQEGRCQAHGTVAGAERLVACERRGQGGRAREEVRVHCGSLDLIQRGDQRAGLSYPARLAQLGGERSVE
jgi:hypothetical protein